MNRNTTIVLLLVLGLAVAFVGCDSDGDDTPPEELILGAWQASEASISTQVPGVRITVLDASNADQVAMTFEADGDYTLSVEGPIEIEVPQVGQTITIQGGDASGTYDLEANDQVRFTTDGVAGSVAVDYNFRGSNQLDLSVQNTDEGRRVIALLLGVELDSPVLNLVTGGTLTLRRAS